MGVFTWITSALLLMMPAILEPTWAGCPYGSIPCEAALQGHTYTCLSGFSPTTPQIGAVYCLFVTQRDPGPVSVVLAPHFPPLRLLKIVEGNREELHAGDIPVARDFSVAYDGESLVKIFEMPGSP